MIATTDATARDAAAGSADREPTNVYDELAKEWRARRDRLNDLTADERVGRLQTNAYYYDALRTLLNFIVEDGKRVLCVRSDVGQYLEWVRPSRGLGIETSEPLVDIARRRCPQYEFRTGEFEDLDVQETFDYVLITNGVNHIFDVQQALAGLRRNCEPHTRVVILFYNFLWQPLVQLAERFGLKSRQAPENWLSPSDVAGMLYLAGFDVVRGYRSTLVPVRVPLVSAFVNRFIAPLPGFNRLCFVQCLVARPTAEAAQPVAPKSVSVIIPCKNEVGNIEAAVRRTPEMGSHTELIFCDDHSTDGTADEVRRIQALYPRRDIRLIAGPGISKAKNVWAGFDAARGDVLMILDADLAVPPEELPRFYEALLKGRGEFINGSRMVYPMRDQAMRLLNIFGNKAFSLLFSYILRQNIKDTLCGTKVLSRRDYERLRPFRDTWGITDRWGDYELIFGAARCNLKIVDLPVHYMERVHGATKMTGRLGNARVMFRMCVAAARKFR